MVLLLLNQRYSSRSNVGIFYIVLTNFVVLKFVFRIELSILLLHETIFVEGREDAMRSSSSLPSSNEVPPCLQYSKVGTVFSKS